MTVTKSGGTVLLAPMFATGSAPSSMIVQSTTIHGNVTAKTESINLLALGKKTLTLHFLFQFLSAASAPEYVAKLDFAAGAFPLSLDGTGDFRCGGGAMPLAPGVHSVNVAMAIDGVGLVSSYFCTVDSGTGTSVAVPSSTTLVVELGNIDSGSGNFAVSYDSIAVLAQ